MIHKNGGGVEEFITWDGCKKVLLIKSPDSLKNITAKVLITVESGDEIRKQLEEMCVKNIEGLYDELQEYENEDRSGKSEYRLLLKRYIEDTENNIGFGTWISTKWLDDHIKYIYKLWDNHYEIPFFFQRVKKMPDRDAKIFDYGFGVGTTYFWLRTNGYKNIKGVEVDGKKYRILKQKCIEKQFPLEWLNELTLYDGVVLPYKDNFFEYIICDNVIEHVQDVKGSISEMLRVLKPNGVIRLTLPDYYGSYEVHYCLDIGKQLNVNKEYFRDCVKKHNGKTDFLDTLNFVTKDELCSYAKELEYNVEIEDNSIIGYVDIVIKKIS